MKEFLLTKLEEEDFGNIWFRQNEADMKPKLHLMFLFLKIALSAVVVWPPRSCDLTSCYVDKPQTIDALKVNISEAIDGIKLHIFENVLKNGQPKQAFECNYFPLLTGRIVFSNKEKKFEKILSISKKIVIWRTLCVAIK